MTHYFGLPRRPEPTSSGSDPFRETGLSTDSLSATDGGNRDFAVISAVSIAHGVSHFFQLIVAPLFPWLKDEFMLSFAELGLLMSVFFVISGIGQVLAGFVVDRVGPLPVLFGSLILFLLSTLVLASAQGYVGLMAGVMLAGLGNASFHPVDYSILNVRVSQARLARGYALHGVFGSLGWAFAPLLLVGVATFAGWRVALLSAGLVAVLTLALVWAVRDALQVVPQAQPAPQAGQTPVSVFAFLRLPAVWFSFAYFFALAFALGGVQSFGPESARQLHDVPAAQAALCLSLYMFGSAGGVLVGGFMLKDPDKAERVVAIFTSLGAVLAILLGLLSWPAWFVPVIFSMMGFCWGYTTPARDLLIRRAAPPGATGRVYGVVYSGLDAGVAIAPAVFGLMMDAHWPTGVWLGIALFQGLLVASALRVGRLGREAQASAAAAR
jgi:MFS family permease